MSRSSTIPVAAAFAGFALALALVLLLGPLLAPFGLWGFVVLQLAALALPAAMLARLAPDSPAITLGLKAPAARVIAGSVLIGSSFWLINAQVIAPLALELLGGKQELLEQSNLYQQANLPALLAAQALIPAVCEELLFRGILARSLQRRFGRWPAVLVSAIAFAAVHWPASRMLPAFATGVVLGYVALASGSTAAAMVVHFINNAIALSLARTASGAETTSGAPWSESAALVTLAVAVGVVVVGFTLVRGRNRQ